MRACTACGKELTKVWEDQDPKYEQFDNALHVRFLGGYGEFIDPMNEYEELFTIICHECAHDLCERVPWIKKMLVPDRSHTHREW